MATWRQEPHTGYRSPAADSRFVWLSLLAFVALTTALAFNHVMWRDEVRALSVAINSASWGDLVRNLHTEGHPIVWYAVLRAGYALTHSVLVMPVLSLAFSAGAAYLILRFAPFPAWTRLVLVFGVFLGYEFSVVTRNYSIAILLMIVASILFPKRAERPLALGLTLAIMANTSIHAAIGSLVIMFVWLMDVFNPLNRPALLRLPAILALAIVVAGVVVAVLSARPSPDMAFAPDLSTLDLGALLRKILKDPGSSLAGPGYSDVAAAGTLPWTTLGIDPGTAHRVIVNIALLSIGWSVRKNRACLLGMLFAVLGFAILFRVAYSPSPRHQGVLFFVLVSLCWIACLEPTEGATPSHQRRIALGMLPLLVPQLLMLPVRVRRQIIYPESSSRLFAQLIQGTPRYRDAIIMSEPDYVAESMPYYLPNRVFMPRQREFHYRVYFDEVRRQKRLTLGGLVGIVDSVTCATGEIALLAIAHLKVFTDSAGRVTLGYRGAEFIWDPADKAKLLARGKQVAVFDKASEENYRVFEIAPRVGSGCVE
ncbi:MAG: hypothetical protein ABIW94_03500 [Gemmatimonadaceae bacterium]